jgi:hypothetical protein
MYASASTWLFNVVRQILEVAQQNAVHTAFISGKESDLVLGPPGIVTIIKSHEIDNEARILDVARQSRKILITIRDPRDAVTSLIEAHKYDFDRALNYVEQSASLCKSFAKDRRAKLFQYETAFAANPNTVLVVAAHLGYSLEKAAARSIYASLSRAEVEKHINKLPGLPGILKDKVSGDLLDAKTQWHSHHGGRDGEIGKWKRKLTPKQAESVVSRLGSFFEMLEVP